MDIKEYLNQAYRVDERISIKFEQIQKLRELGTKAEGNGRIISAGTAKKIREMEHRIDADIENLIGIKTEITNVIKQVKNRECQELLELRYLCYRKWEDIASQMNYSTDYIFALHRKALDAVKKIRGV